MVYLELEKVLNTLVKNATKESNFYQTADAFKKVFEDRTTTATDQVNKIIKIIKNRTISN